MRHELEGTTQLFGFNYVAKASPAGRRLRRWTIGCSGKDALPGTVFRVLFIGNLVRFLMPGEEGLDLFDAFDQGQPMTGFNKM